STASPSWAAPPSTALFTAAKITSCCSRCRPASHLREAQPLSGPSSKATPDRFSFKASPSRPAATITSYHEPMRQPVHVVYGGAHLFKSDTTSKLGELAQRALAEYAPDAATLAEAVGIRDDLAATVYQRVVEKLRREPVEDYRIDFEDGFGIRSDAEEDSAADAAAAQLSTGFEGGTLPPFIGLRVKSFAPES